MNTSTLETSDAVKPVDMHNDVPEVAQYEHLTHANAAILAPVAAPVGAPVLVPGTKIDMSPRSAKADLAKRAPYVYDDNAPVAPSDVPESNADLLALVQSDTVVMPDGRVLTAAQADAEEDARLSKALKGIAGPGGTVLIGVVPQGAEEDALSAETVEIAPQNGVAPVVPAVAPATEQSADEQAVGVWFSDEEDAVVGSITFNDNVHRPETIWFGALPDALIDEILDMPLHIAKELNCTVEQATDMKWLNQQKDYDKVWPLMKYIRDLMKRVRLAGVRKWTFGREVSPENIEKLPDVVRTVLAERVMDFVRGGEAEVVFTLPESPRF